MAVGAGISFAFAGGCGTSREPSGAVVSGAKSAAPVATAGGRGADAAHDPPVEGEVRYLALGDSFTIGTGSPEEASFPSRLSERLRARGQAVTLKNLGVNGYRTEELLEREAPEIVGFRPTMVTLAIGANDLVNGSSKEHYRAQVKLVFKALEASGVARGSVLVLPQPDWSRSVVADSFGDRAKIHVAIEEFNDVLHEEASLWGARWVELWPLMARQAEQGLIANDGLHPSAPAYDAWAEALSREIEKK